MVVSEAAPQVEEEGVDYELLVTDTGELLYIPLFEPLEAIVKLEESLEAPAKEPWAITCLRPIVRGCETYGAIL